VDREGGVSAEDGRRRDLSLPARLYVSEIAKGLILTARHFWTNIILHACHSVGLFRRVPAGVTIQYPEARRTAPGRARHVHRLLRRPDGAPVCVACMLCASACPSSCINIVAEEAPDPAIEKRPAVYEIDLSRCVFCGLCVEACPVDAIRMDTGILPPASGDRFRMIISKEELLALGPGEGKLISIARKF